MTSYVHMTALAVRQEPGTGRRFARQGRRTHLEQLRERVRRGEYAVDAEQVADAIVRRVLERRRT